MAKSSITQDRLKEVLTYDPETGCFTWNIQRGRCKSGSIAGCIHKGGYLQIRIDEQSFLAHRLAFLYMTGAMPDEVDHIDHIRTNNKWANLRPSNRIANQKNQSLFSTNKSGCAGVRLEDGKWRAKISTKHIGRFESYEDAVKARKHAENINGYHKNHGI